MRLSLPFFSGVNDFDEVVFERRNKLYGAYELRRHYNERLQKAFLFSLSMILLLLLGGYFLREEPPVISIGGDGGIILDPPPIIEVIKDKPHPPVSHPTSHVPPEEQPIDVIKDSTNLSPENVDTTAVSTSASTDQNNDSGNTGDAVTSSGGETGTSDVTSGQTQQKDPNKILNWVPEMPSFPGGAPGLARYLARKFDCNDSNHNGFSREGKIILKFVVMKDGTIKDITVLQETVSIDCVEQAKQILLNGPKWNPGKQNNEPVNVMVVQPIIFAVE